MAGPSACAGCLVVRRVGPAGAAQFHSRAAPAEVPAQFQAEGHRTELIAGADAGEGLQGTSAGFVVADVADDGTGAAGSQGAACREPGQFVVGAAHGVAEHAVDGAFAAQDGQETVGEEVGGARLREGAGLLEGRLAGLRGLLEGARGCRPVLLGVLALAPFLGLTLALPPCLALAPSLSLGRDSGFRVGLGGGGGFGERGAGGASGRGCAVRGAAGAAGVPAYRRAGRGVADRPRHHFVHGMSPFLGPGRIPGSNFLVGILYGE